MADSMPARSAQTPLQPGAASGSSLVTPNSPMEASQPAMPGPASGPPAGEMAAGGSSNVFGWVGLALTAGVHNGGQDVHPDVRVIDVPAPPHASQSTGDWSIGDGDR